MPAGVTLASIAAVLAPVGLITVVLRQLPFSFVKWMKDSQFFSLLGMMMPVGVMTILVVYTVYGQAGAPGGHLGGSPRRGGHFPAASVEAGVCAVHLRWNRLLYASRQRSLVALAILIGRTWRWLRTTGRRTETGPRTAR